jgi:hypothetical protein
MRRKGGVSILLILLAIPCTAQESDYNKRAELDEKGNIFVSSDDGKLIWMSDTRHCSEAISANDKQTVGCMVVPTGNGFPVAQSVKVEIYLRGGEKRTLEPGAPILDWHFWEDGQKVSVRE